MSTSAPNAPQDAAPGNWVDARAPAPAKPYLRLMRADRPVGVWLLFWPCVWGLTLVTGAEGYVLPNPGYVFLFLIGAIVMRGAGCVYNDIIDRDIDAGVARTAGRPLPAGQVSPKAAAAFLFALSLIGLWVLVQFNGFTIALGVGSLALVAAYPFMKRITYWPQAWLGLTFNWGVLMGWASETGGLAAPAFALYAAGVAWTLGYDTIYAHQDKEDDALLGVKSTALKFGEKTKIWLGGFYAVAFGLFCLAAALAGLAWPAFAGLALAGLHFAWQVWRLDIDAPDKCLGLFKSNVWIGLIVFLAFVAGAWPA
ncbi:MAG: 4-hydroxybenzoate octaprenyltransferase [Pseudomonadota bacterium]